MSMSVRVVAVVPAAGVGRRFGADGRKALARLCGRPLLYWVLRVLEASPLVAEVLPVMKDGDRALGEALIEAEGFKKVRRMAAGGAERQDSVRNALGAMDDPEAVVLVHDAARPLLDAELVGRVLGGLAGFDGSVAAVPLKDTVKEADEAGVVVRTPRREALRAVQTPQAFRYATLREAHERAVRESFRGTDDAALVERIGGRVRLVMGAYENIKVTTPEDLALAEIFLAKRLFLAGRLKA